MDVCVWHSKQCDCDRMILLAFALVVLLVVVVVLLLLLVVIIPIILVLVLLVLVVVVLVTGMSNIAWHSSCQMHPLVVQMRNLQRALMTTPAAAVASSSIAF